LVTLVGVGGVGKTTIALEVARGAADRYDDGVVVADLTTVSDPQRIGDAVVAALGVEGQAGGDALVAVEATLRRREVLLVLDNCEQVVAAVAELADRLLTAAPGLRLLVTSRERLNIAEETIVAVAPLATPPESVHAVDQLQGYAAVCLFERRAVAARGDFSITDDNAAAVGAICRHLDGIPLAIELAAARVRVLTPQQIADRLDDRFALLTGGSRTAVPRQRTLLAAIDWSYRLLDEPDRLLFERLSVFVGGCTLDAAEHVCSGAGVETPEVLDLIGPLVDKSLLTTAEAAGEVRYGMLETVLQFATAKLIDDQGVEPWRQRHAAYYAALAETGRRIRDDPYTWGPVLSADRSNFTAALEWLYDTGDIRGTGEMAAAL
jgi:predicted ATPase